MTAIYQSPFLIALGWTIAASIWQSALLWLIYQLICNAYRKVNPSVRHSFAAAFLLGSFVWFCFTLTDKYSEVVAINQYLSALPEKESLAISLQDVSRISLFENSLIAFINQYLPYVSSAYLIVLLLLSVKLLKSYLHVSQMKTKGLLPIDDYWINLVEKYVQKIGINKRVNIFLSNYISVPATLNYFKPVILLPLAAFNHLTPQQVESVILHELAHIKRNDYLINIIASVIETVLFFNPFVHLLGKSLQKEREHCCDDFVLQRRFDPHTYASALLSLEQMRVGLYPLAIAATGSNNQLLGRVKRIMNVKTTNFNYGQKLLAFALTTFMMISIAWLAPSSHRNVVPGSTENLDEAVKSLKAADSLRSAGNSTHSSSKSEVIKMAAREVSPASRSRTPLDIYPGTSLGVTPKFAPALPDEVQVRQTEAPLPPRAPVPPALKKDINLRTENRWDTIYFFAPPPPVLDGSSWNNTNQDVFKAGAELLEREQWTTSHSRNAKDKIVSTNDVIKLIDEAKIEKNNLLQQQQQLHILFEKQFNNAQLQPGDMTEMEIERFEAEIKKNNSKRRSVQQTGDFLFSISPDADFALVKKSWIENGSGLDSLRKKSIQIAEKQREMWRNSAEDEMQWSGEKNGDRVFEFTFKMDDFPDFVSSEMPLAFHEKMMELTHSKKNIEGNEKKAVAEKAPRIRQHVFTTIPAQKAAPKHPNSPAPNMRAVKSKTVVITL